MIIITIIIQDDYDDFLKSKKEGTWIQCSKIDCLKWRKLPNNVEPYTIPERWVCAMNSGEIYSFNGRLLSID